MMHRFYITAGVAGLLVGCTTQNTELVDKNVVEGGLDVSVEATSEEGASPAIDGGPDGEVLDAPPDDGSCGAVQGYYLGYVKPGCDAEPQCTNDHDAMACTVCRCDGLTEKGWCVPRVPWEHSGSCSEAGANPQEVASDREVRFHVSNALGSARFLAVDGSFCVPWSVDRLEPGGWKPAILGLSSTSEFCACGGTSCDYFGGEATKFEKLDPGSTTSIAWDGRTYAGWLKTNYCDDYTTWKSYEGVLLPAAPGHYRVRLGVHESLGAECSSEAGNLWTCNVQAPVTPPGVEPLCAAPSQPTVEFDIPESGDVDVAITLNQ